MIVVGLRYVDSSVKVCDFTSLAETSESVVLVYFEESDGIVHVYRDGTVVLSSPQRTTLTRLPQTHGPVWRKEGFLALLSRLGASEQELAHAAEIAAERETALTHMGFEAAVDHALAESRAHYDAWRSGQPSGKDEMAEAEIAEWLAAKIKEVRDSHD
jgi:hypothetical protein